MDFDINKVTTIITVISEGLKHKVSYRIACDVTDIELQELKQNFKITEDNNSAECNVSIYGKNRILIFSKHEQIR